MLIVDVETSGVDITTNQILSIGAVDLNDPTNMFYGECQLSNWKTYSQEALNVNWFWINEINSLSWKQTLADLIKKFSEFKNSIKDWDIIGWQNIAFDISFLKQAEKETWIKLNIWHRYFDLHSFAYWLLLSNWLHIPQKDWKDNLSLDEILKLAWLPEEPKPHNWLNWAKYEAEVISRLVFGKKLLPEFEQFKKNNSLKINKFNI